MKIKGLLLSFACAVALCFGLVGCGGAAPENYTANFAGDWTLYAIDSEENASTPEDVAMMRDLGLTCSLSLSEDGVAKLDLFGDTTEGTWEAQSAESATITIQDQPATITLTEDMLTLEQATDSAKLVFERGTAATSAASSATAADAATSEAPAEEAATSEAPAEEAAAEAPAEEAAAEGESSSQAA